MEHSFWHDRWATNQIGFHQPAANPLLVTHCAALALPSAGRVLLPLCGKTLDVAWLLAAGYQIVGVDEADIAKNKISVASPLARAMISKKPGDEVKLSTPKGHTVFEIRAVFYR